MSKIREFWENFGDGWGRDVEAAITEAEAELTALRQSAETSAMVAEQAVAELKAARAEIERLKEERDTISTDRFDTIQDLRADIADLTRERDEARAAYDKKHKHAIALFVESMKLRDERDEARALASAFAATMNEDEVAEIMLRAHLKTKAPTND